MHTVYHWERGMAQPRLDNIAGMAKLAPGLLEALGLQ